MNHSMTWPEAAVLITGIVAFVGFFCLVVTQAYLGAKDRGE